MTQDEFKSALEADGFRISKDGLASEYNEAKWYACKTFREETGPDCECNDKLPQIVVRPWYYTIRGNSTESAEISLTAEAGGEWYELKAYSIGVDRCIETLPKIAASLYAMWRAIPR